jgi:NYN domain
VDIIAHAWDHPAPQTIVIISGDRDLTYMIGTLRMRKYEVILISPNGAHTSFANLLVNLDWIADGHRRDVDDARGGQPPPSPHPPSPPHQFPSPSFPSPPLPAANGFYSHYPKTNFLSKTHEIDPPLVELQGIPTARGRQKPAFSHSDKFNIFGDLGGLFPSPSVSNNGIFGIGDSRSQSHPARQVRSDSAPPGIYTIHSPVSPLDSSDFGPGRIAKEEQRKFPITEHDDIAPQSPSTAKLPEEPPMAEGLFTSMQSSAKMKAPLSVPTCESAEPVNIDNQNTMERGKSSSTTVVSSPRKKQVISTKESPRADLPKPQAPDPSPTPLLPSQKASPSKQITLNAQAGPSSTSSRKYVPPHFQVLVDTLRQHGGSHMKSSLPSLLLMRDQAVYKKAQVSKYTPYIAAAVEAMLVREVVTTKGCFIFLTEEYA